MPQGARHAHPDPHSDCRAANGYAYTCADDHDERADLPDSDAPASHCNADAHARATPHSDAYATPTPHSDAYSRAAAYRNAHSAPAAYRDRDAGSAGSCDRIA